MTKIAQCLIDEAKQLPPMERAQVIEELLTSLDQPDPAIATLWAKEAEDRLDAYDRGELKAIDAEEAFARLNKK